MCLLVNCDIGLCPGTQGVEYVRYVTGLCLWTQGVEYVRYDTGLCLGTQGVEYVSYDTGLFVYTWIGVCHRLNCDV